MCCKTVDNFRIAETGKMTYMCDNDILIRDVGVG